MNCVNCGAPMTLFRDQDYFYCEYCGSFHFPPASTEGVRLLGNNPEGSLCPHCQIPLQHVTLDDRFRGYLCPGCQGFLFERNTFRDTIETRRALVTTPPEAPRPLNPAELERRIDCPVCAREMSTHPYLGPGTIVIDTCSQCNLIWLDNGELNRVVNAPGSDRGIGTAARIEETNRWTQKPAKPRKKERWESNLLSLLEHIFEIDD